MTVFPLVRAVPWVLALGLALPLAARAQSGDDEARRHFRLAEAHYANSSFEEAAREFEDAYRLSQRPALLYNVYLSWRDAGDARRAAAALRQFLELSPDHENAASLRGRLAALERTIAAQEQQGGEAAEGGDGSTDAADGAEPAGPQRATGDAAEGTRSEPVDDGTPEGGSGGSLLPWIVGGAGLALVVGGAVTGVLALGAQSDLESECPDRACPEDYDHEGAASGGRALALVTDVLLVAGVAAVGTGVVLLALGGGDEEPALSAGLACDGTGCAATARGRF